MSSGYDQHHLRDDERREEKRIEGKRREQKSTEEKRREETELDVMNSLPTGTARRQLR